MKNKVLQVPYVGGVKLEFKVFRPGALASKEFTQAFHEQTKNNFTEAVELYKKSYKTDRNTLKITNNLAACLWELGEFEKAEELWENTPKANKALIYNLCVVNVLKGSTAKGFRYIAECFEEKPECYLLRGILFYLSKKESKAIKDFCSFKSTCKDYQHQESNNLLKASISEKHLNGSLSRDNNVRNHLARFTVRPRSSSRRSSSSLMSLSVSPNKSPPNSNLPKIKVNENLRQKSRFPSVQSLGEGLSREVPKATPRNNPTPPGFKMRSVLSADFSSHKELGDFKTQFDYGINSHSETKPPVQVGNLTYSCQTLESIIEELQKPDKNINYIMQFARKLRFFSEYTESSLRRVIKNSSYECFEAESIIFEEGSKCDKLYVILKGSCIVRKNLETDKSFTVSSRYDGEVIGEYSIIRKACGESPFRNATCIASERTHMMTVPDSEFILAIENNVREDSKILDFLKQLKLFKHIPTLDLVLLSSSLKQKTYSLGEVVCKAGEVPQGMVILFEGRLRVPHNVRVKSYSVKTSKFVFKHETRDVYFFPGEYFGQRVLFEDFKKSKFSVIADSSKTVVLILSNVEYDMIFEPYRARTFRVLNKTKEFDINS